LARWKSDRAANKRIKIRKENKMKKFRWVGVFLMVGMLAFGLTACSGNEGARPSAEAEQDDRAQPADQAAQPMKADEQSAEAPPAEQPQEAAEAPGDAEPAGEIGTPEVAEIMGTVLDADGEIVVFTDQGNYAVTGEDLSDMVGKTVRVLGSLQEDGGRRTIKVISVYEIK
jgi:hypothetical protein